MLLREVENRLHLIDRISNCIIDRRDPRYIDHTMKELLTQQIFQIAAGYEDCDDCDDLRGDTVFKMSCNRLPQSGVDLGSQPTMSRLENAATPKDLLNIGKQ